MSSSFFNQRVKAKERSTSERLARMPWVEKYRPKDLTDITAQDHAVNILQKSLKRSSNLPHMLFYGPPGTGKTSTILALAKELYGPELYKSRVLELNASDERGISIVREKVKNFARLTISNPTKEDLEKYPCPPYKIIILDEADSMTNDAQSALRRTMETYSTVTRFCLICNYITRIIDPLASRCSKFRFKPLNSDSALQRLSYIAKQEDVQYDTPEVLQDILKISNGDLRKAITFLQSATKLTLIDADGDSSMALTRDNIFEIAGLVPEKTINLIVKKYATFAEILQLSQQLFADGWNSSQILTQLHEKLILDDSVLTDKKIKIAMILNEADLKLTNGTDEQIQILNTMCQLNQV